MADFNLDGITFDETADPQFNLDGITLDQPEAPAVSPISLVAADDKKNSSILESIPSIGRWLMGPSRGPVTKPGEDPQFEAARATVGELGTPDADTQQRIKEAGERVSIQGVGGAGPIVNTIFPNLPMPLRAAIEGAARGGAAIEDTVLRFFGYGESADRNRRAVEALAKYNRALDETSIFGKVVGPMAGGLTTALAQGTLAGPTGRAGMAASFGIDGADRGYVEYKDKFPDDENGALLHGAAQGAVDGLLTYIGGGLALRFGAQTGDTFAPVVGREILRAAQSTGLREVLKTSLFEAGEEGVQQALTSLEAVRSGVDPEALDSIVADVISATVVGAVGGSVGPSVGIVQHNIVDRYKKFRAEVPDRLDAVQAANIQSATGEPANTEGKSEAWKDSFNSEFEALAALELELNARGVDVRADEKALEAERKGVEEDESELSSLRKELLENRAVESPQREALAESLRNMEDGIRLAKQNLAEKDAAVKTRRAKLEKELAPQRKYLEDELYALEAKAAKSEGRTMETAVPTSASEPGSTLPPVTSARQESLDRDRAAFGLDEIPKKQSVSFIENLELARARGVQKNAQHISSQLLIDMRPVDAVTEAGLADRLREIKNEHEPLRVARDAAPAQRDKDSRNAEIRALEAEYDVISEALHLTGSEIGSALVNRKLQLANDFSGPNVVSRARRAKGQGSMAKLSDSERNSLAKLTDELADIESRLATLPPGDEANDLDYRRHKLKIEINDKIRSFEPKTLGTRAVGAVVSLQDLIRTMTMGFDLQPILRQGMTTLRTRPLVLMKPTADFFRAWGDDKKAFLIERAIKFDPDFDLAKKHGLAFIEEDSPLSAREDQLQSILAERMPIVRNFQRGYRVFMNSMRMGVFKASMRSYGGRDRLTDSNLKHLSNFVNISTGRGGLGSFEASAHTLSQGFIAPRFYMSGIQYVTGQPMWRALWEGDRKAASIMAREYARALIGAAILNYTALSLGRLAFGDQVSYTPFSIDPTNPTAGYLKIGKSQVDLTGGMGKYVRIGARMGENVHATLTGDKRDEDSLRTIGNTVLSSAAPHARLIGNLLSGRAGYDKEASAKNILFENYLPLTPKDVFSAFQHEGVGKGTAISIMTLFGGSSFTREKNR